MKYIFILIALFFILSLKLYSDNNLEKIQDEIAKEKLDTRLFKEKYITNNPESPLSVLFLFQINKNEEAQLLLNMLTSKNIPEAIYAEAVISLKGKYLPANNEAINILKQQCSLYIEPCVYLGSYFRNNKQYKPAIKYLKKAQEENEITIFSELRLIYSDKNSSYYNPEKASFYASEMTYAIHHKTRTRYHLTKYTE